MLFKKYIVLLLSIFAVSMPTSAEMVAHWDFNGTSGTTVTESINGYNATINGGAVLDGSGELYLDGTNDYVSMPVGSVVSGLSSFTITAKINFSGTGSSWQRVFTFGDSTSEFMNFAFTNTADDEVALKCRYNSHDEVTYATNYSSLAGEHYFVITLDAPNEISRVYIDGHIIEENRWAAFVPSVMGATANNWLGKSEYSAGAYFKGYFDDFRIYNTVLTPAEIGELAGFGGAIEPSPIDRYMGEDFNSVTLSWQAGNSGTSFDVYFSDSLASVTNASNSLPVGGIYKGQISGTSFSVSNLNPRTPYYWRVDEIDSQGNPITGKVWRFTTIPNGTPVKVMCFNIRYDNLYGVSSSTDPNAWNYSLGTDRKDRVINIITSGSEAFGTTGPDILGVQEAVANQVTDLKSSLTDYGFYGVVGDATYSYCGIFYRSSRFTLQSSGTFWLSETPTVASSKYSLASYVRLASWVILEDSINEQNYFVLNTHLDTVGAAAIYSAGLIRDEIDSLAGGLPVIVMGDLNVNESNEAYLILIGEEDTDGMQLADAYRSVYPRVKETEITCHGWDGGMYGSRIDFIFHTDDFYSGRATIERDKGLDEYYPSDHYPVTTTIYYRDFLDADLNQDRSVDFEDLTLFAADWLETGYYVSADEVGLVGHWDFEGTAGDTNVPDSAGDNNAVIVGSSLNGSGGVTLAGGTNAQYVDLGSGLGSVISGLSDCTIIVDFTWDGNSAGTYQRIWTFSQSGTTQFATLTFVAANEEYIRFQHRYSSHDESTNASTTSLKGRHQIAIAMNSAYSTHGSVQLYLDGVQEAFHTQTVEADLSLLGTTTRNYLGKSPFDAGNYFDGTIHDFRIYNKYLSADEIADIYNGTVEQTYISLDSASNFYDDEIINFLDFAVFAESWLESQ